MEIASELDRGGARTGEKLDSEARRCVAHADDVACGPISDFFQLEAT